VRKTPPALVTSGGTRTGGNWSSQSRGEPRGNPGNPREPAPEEIGVASLASGGIGRPRTEGQCGLVVWADTGGTRIAMALCVSLPRPVREGTTYMITRRTTQRQFLLRPSALTNQIFLYCLAVAAERTGVLLHAVCVLSTAGWKPQGSHPSSHLPRVDTGCHGTPRVIQPPVSTRNRLVLLVLPLASQAERRGFESHIPL